jgi:hypothetical protein
VIVCCAVFVGCGGSDGGGSPKLQGELRSSQLGYAVRYPEGWHGAKGEQGNSVGALQGPGDRECVVAPVLGLPDWSSDASRRSYYDALASRRRLKLRSSGPVKAANTEGWSAVVGSGKRLVRATTVASAGVGVSLSCSAPKSDFDSADGDVFRPMAESVRVRRDPAAERLQPRLAALNGVSAAGVALSKDRAQGQLRLTSREAGVPAVKEALRLLVSGLDADRVGVQAFEQPANPVVGNWDARTQRAFVQAVPNPPQRYRLERTAGG